MGLSLTHIILILVVVLILFGPSRLPGLGKSLGEAIRGFKKGLGENEIDVTDSTRHEQIRDGEQNSHTAQKTEHKEKV